MRIAILYTGEERTIRGTMPYFKQNILSTNEVDVFAVIQSGDPANTEAFMRENIPSLKSLQFFNRDDGVWQTIRENLLNTMNISDSWKHYLRTSGSMIEYYQLYLTYQGMIKEENNRGISYDYVIRCRTDVVYTRPLDFSWTTISEEEILSRFMVLKEKTGESMNSVKTVQLFMNSLIHPKRADSEFCDNTALINSKDAVINAILQETDEAQFIKRMKDYIENGSYIITLRANIVYLLKRKFASLIPAIGVMYGLIRSADYGVQWFDAESQFKTFCHHYGLTTFESFTRIENSSMYEYDTNNFFEGGVLRDRDDMLFFIMRH